MSKLTALPVAKRTVQKYTNDQIHNAALEMEAIGGHFASRIAQAYFYADSTNRSIILDAFGHLFERFIKEDQQ